MKFNYLIKATPFLSTLLLILCLNINNQNENTKLKILIWETPSLTLGTYVALSTATGFLFSYLITSNLAKHYRTTPKKSLEYKDESKYEEDSKQKDIFTNSSNDYTLIERDIKDPSPTINASFRVIGRKDRNNLNFINNNNLDYDDSTESYDQLDEDAEKNESVSQVRPFPTDWNDESFSTW